MNYIHLTELTLAAVAGIFIGDKILDYSFAGMFIIVISGLLFVFVTTTWLFFGALFLMRYLLSP